MIVLAESNFVLELAFQQEEQDEVERLVVMAEAREVELVIPACALFEPYETRKRGRKSDCRAEEPANTINSKTTPVFMSDYHNTSDSYPSGMGSHHQDDSAP
jgi:hypothetical protein